jgi:hypothetical protein
MKKSDLEALTHEQLVEFVWGIMRSLRAALDGNLGDKTDTPAPSSSPLAPSPLPPHTPPTPVPPHTPTLPPPTHTQEEKTTRTVDIREEGCGEKPQTALALIHSHVQAPPRTQEEAKQEEVVPVLPTRLTSVTMGATLASGTVSTIGLSLYVMQGKKPANAKGSMAPDLVLVHTGTLMHWQEKGWRGDLAHMQDRLDVCMDWYRGKGQRSPDWGAIINNWLRRDIQRGDDLPAARTVSYGQQGHGANRTGSGYDRNGQPTNKATKLLTTAQQLAVRHSAAGMAEEVGPDTATFSDADRGFDRR